MSHLDAVLFDFDGVIVDTENVHIAAWQRTLGRIGWTLSDAEALPSVEIDDHTWLADLFLKRNVTGGDVVGWVRRKGDLVDSLIGDAPRIYPGVTALVRALREHGTKLAVVTSTWRKSVETVLRIAGLADDFDAIVSKEDVAAKKPAPDAYLKALERLGLPKDRVIALEDSGVGLRSAHAAGITAIAVGHRHAEGAWSSGHSYLQGLASTSDVLEVLGRSREPRP